MAAARYRRRIERADHAPGSLGNADIFYLQLLHLASRARYIAIDYPESPTAALADGLAALIDVLNIGRVKRSAASRP
jgi:hypothetical protein